MGSWAALYAGRSDSFFGLHGVSDVSTTEHLAAFDANTGAIQWDTPEGASLNNPEAITDNLVILDSATVSQGPIASIINNKLEALDINTGLVQWLTYLPVHVSHVAVAGNLIYVVTSDGTTPTLRTYDLATGKAVSSTALPSSSTVPQPIVAEGHVYLVGPSSIDAYAPAAS